MSARCPCSGPFYQDYYKDDKEGRIALLNCLAAYNTTVAARTRNKQVYTFVASARPLNPQPYPPNPKPYPGGKCAARATYR